MQRIIAALLVGTAASAACAESVTYEIYDFAKDPKGVLVAKGVRTYRPQELEVVVDRGRGETHWQKSLELQDGYRIAASIYRQSKISGFGIWAESGYCGFSWEWFRSASPDRFDKLQETGSVSVEYRAVEGLKELASITFDTDISLRINETENDVDAVTQRVVIKKGSVLAFGTGKDEKTPSQRECRPRVTSAAKSLVVGPFHSEEEVSEWLMNYYRKPDPAHLMEALEYMSRSGALDRKHAIAPVAGFLAGVFRDHPGEVAGWVEGMATWKEEHLAVAVLGLWYADLPESRARAFAVLEKHPRLNAELGHLRSGAPTPVEKLALENGPAVLDTLWGNFMATGRKEPVERIIKTLPWLDTKGDINHYLTAASARWSLTSNAVQHDRVFAICEAALDSAPEEISVRLREIVEEARKQRAARSLGSR